MKKFLFLLTVVFQFQCVYDIKVKSKVPNYFFSSEDEINFGRLAATNFKFTSSSCLSNENCTQNLFDSNLNSFWISNTGQKKEWIIIDFKEKRLMNRIEIELPTPNQFEKYEVQVLHRGNWKTIFETSKILQSNQSNFGNIDATLIRVLFTKNTTNSLQISNLRILLNSSNLTGIDKHLTGFRFPVPSGLLPLDDYSFPGAPRKYRNGTHKGVDISYKSVNQKRVLLTKNDLAICAKDGVIVRSDLNYKPMTANEYKSITEYNKNNRVTYVDKDFGGRQVWIDHGNGVMTSYNHLSSIADGMVVGRNVFKGEPIGFIGNSGLMGEIQKNNSGVHLHYEIWINGEYVGFQISPNDSKRFLQYFFTE